VDVNIVMCIDLSHYIYILLVIIKHVNLTSSKVILLIKVLNFRIIHIIHNNSHYVITVIVTHIVLG